MPFDDKTELSAAPLDCGSPSADVSCTTSPVQANFTALSSDRVEGSLLLRNTTLWKPKSVQIFNDHLHHLFTAWEVNSFCGDWYGSGSKEAIIPRYDSDLRTVLKLIAAFPLVSLFSTTPLDTSCTPCPKTCMPCQHMVLNFPGRGV